MFLVRIMSHSGSNMELFSSSGLSRNSNDKNIKKLKDLISERFWVSLSWKYFDGTITDPKDPHDQYVEDPKRPPNKDPFPHMDPKPSPFAKMPYGCETSLKNTYVKNATPCSSESVRQNICSTEEISKDSCYCDIGYEGRLIPPTHWNNYWQGACTLKENYCPREENHFLDMYNTKQVAVTGTTKGAT